MQANFVALFNSFRTADESVDGELGHTYVLSVDDHIPRLNLAWDHSIIQCVRNKEVDRVEHLFNRKACIELPFKIVNVDWPVLLVTPIAVENARVKNR